MKKLGSVEKVEDFFLAVAGGADVNGTWRGSPLVEYFFTRSMQNIVFYPTKHPRAKEDADARKLEILLLSGADVSPLFTSSYEYYEYIRQSCQIDYKTCGIAEYYFGKLPSP